ncbi:haloacid dehalogenase-like hydrolase [Acidaminobacter sp. JC074]|uniref:DUF7916 family protein n=1 Tax=Acidaminobacter sp. JC074 TaxID=2530199 RepID=UPI001F0ECE47|nr:haloacid dehalogenase-like hydrolase [Acidaminobacter sp. JC074]MCH4890829.1 haloacid dehalogenase-like hydrolase [Acidaminobacter sp. JC074]
MKRIIDRFGVNDAFNNEDLLESIKKAEGRTMVSEIICPITPLLYDVSNVELAAAFGADIVLLNMYDVNMPIISGIDCLPDESPIQASKRLTGRFIGVNLEPVDESLEQNSIPPGRQATLENIQKLIHQGADFVVLTGNPKVGVSHASMVKSIKEIKDKFKDRIIVVAGRMHASGDINAIGRNLIDSKKLNEIIDAGSDIILLPAPATVPGISREIISDMIQECHLKNKLVMTTIGTSQEGADKDTIKRIALMAKEAGSDLHHIGDCGYGPGITVPENIMHYSIVIKGRRHTYRKMAASINR